MELSVAIIVAIVAVIVFATAYRFKAATQLPEEKPAIALLPKYVVDIQVPREVLGSEDMAAELTRFMKPLGFENSETTREAVCFSRGSILGDFSVNLTKVVLTFPLPLKNEVQIQVMYGAFAAFDTGDLWQFSTELSCKLSPAT